MMKTDVIIPARIIDDELRLSTDHFKAAGLKPSNLRSAEWYEFSLPEPNDVADVVDCLHALIEEAVENGEAIILEAKTAAVVAAVLRLKQKPRIFAARNVTTYVSDGTERDDTYIVEAK